MWAAATTRQTIGTTLNAPDGGTGSPVSRSQRSSPRSLSSSDDPTSSRSQSNSSRHLSSSPPAQPSRARKEPAEMATDTTTETATETPAQSPNGRNFETRRRKLWGWILDVLIGIKVPIGLFFLAVAVGAFVGWNLYTRTEHTDRQARERDRIDEIRNDYDAAVDDYNRDLQVRAVCLSRVEVSEANRAQHQLLVDTIRVLAPESEGVQALAAALQSGPLLGADPLSVDDCPPVPEKPARPPEIGREFTS